MLSKEEIEKAKRICKLLCGKKNKKGKREYKTFTRMQMQIDYTVDQMAEAIEILLQYIDQLENQIQAKEMEHKYDVNMIDEVKGEAVKLYNKIEQLEQENKRLTHTNKSYKGIINKQNKIIDKMAEYIVELIKFNNCEELREVEEIKQYFEKKVEEK